MGKQYRREPSPQGSPQVTCWDKSKEHVFDSGIKVVQRCELQDELLPCVLIGQLARRKTLALNQALPATEWLGYLIGEEDKESGLLFIIQDIQVPLQEATAASAKDIDPSPQPVGVVGTIHWHHSMDIGFSQTDIEFAGSNHPVTVVVSHQDWKAVVRVILPCGALTCIDAEVDFEEETGELAGFVSDSLGKIQQSRFGYGSSPPSSASYSTGYPKPTIITAYPEPTDKEIQDWMKQYGCE